MKQKKLSLKDYKKENNTLKREIKSDLKERIELEIGDAKQKDFYPQAKMKKWDNEVNFSLRYDNGARSFKEKNGKIICEGNEDVDIYELDGFEDGGLEFEIVLKDKPEKNIFNFTIETKGLNFFYQGELTEKEKERGAKRPEKVVGSYAVYHKTKKNNNKKGKSYKTGKFFHIYRPKATDNSGKETYCNLNIEEKILSVEVPQEFLDKASYPVKIDPTFGYESAGSSSSNLVYWDFTIGYQYWIFGSKYNLAEDGDVESVTAYIDDTGTGNKQYAIYDSNQDYKDNTEKSDFDGTEDWHKLDFSSALSLSSGDYWLLAASDSEDEDLVDQIHYDSADSEIGGYQSTTSSAWVDNWPSSTDLTFPERKYSIYATYTADEEPTGTNTQINIGDSWKEISAMKINIGDSWKDVSSAQINIGDSWKSIF